MSDSEYSKEVKEVVGGRKRKRSKLLVKKPKPYTEERAGVADINCTHNDNDMKICCASSLTLVDIVGKLSCKGTMFIP